ncbi:MAG: phosphatase PAP2 family protein [Actinocatenispora sp.]
MRPTGWWFDLILVAIFAAITIALVKDHLLGLDNAALQWSDNHRNALSWWTGYWLSCLGQGGPLTYGTLGVAVFLAWRRKTVRPVLVPVAAFMLTYLIVGPIKVWSNRAVPHHGPIEMFAHPSGPYSMAYPSGHTANAIVWYGALMLLIGPYLPRMIYWLVRFAAPLTVATAMVYIDYHWLTDVVAALPLGLFLSRMLYRIPFDTIQLPPWSRRSPEPVLDDPRRPQPMLPSTWPTVPQVAPVNGQHPAPLLTRIWSGGDPAGIPDRQDRSVRRLAEHHDVSHRRRPAPVGSSGRQGRFIRDRGTPARTVRGHDDQE